MGLDLAFVGVGLPPAKELDVVIEDACLLCPGDRSSAERVSGVVTRGACLDQKISELVDHECSVKVAKIPLVVLWIRWTLEKSGVSGAAGHPSSSRWRAETAQGEGS